MITLLSILVILSAVGIVATVAAVISDGYRPIRTDWSRIPRRTREPEAAPETTGEPARMLTEPTVHVVAPRRRPVRKTSRAAHRLP